jgi:hypothetical protein
MALRIEKAFGARDALLPVQAWHDSHALRRRTGEIWPCWMTICRPWRGKAADP